MVYVEIVDLDDICRGIRQHGNSGGNQPRAKALACFASSSVLNSVRTVSESASVMAAFIIRNVYTYQPQPRPAATVFCDRRRSDFQSDMSGWKPDLQTFGVVLFWLTMMWNDARGVAHIAATTHALHRELEAICKSYRRCSSRSMSGIAFVRQRRTKRFHYLCLAHPASSR